MVRFLVLGLWDYDKGDAKDCNDEDEEGQHLQGPSLSGQCCLLADTKQWLMKCIE